MTADQLFEQAFARHRSGQIADAEAGYKATLRTDPRHARALHHLGILDLQRGRLKEAADLIGRSIASDPSSAEAHYHAGMAFGMAGRFDECIAHSRRAIELRPNYAEAHMNLGNALKAKGAIADAAASYRAAVAANPALAEAHFNLGNILSESKDHTGAIAAYQSAISIRGDFADAHLNLGAAFMASQRTDDAVASFLRALSIRPDFVPALTSLALALIARGDRINALPAIARLLDIKPSRQLQDMFTDCVAESPSVPDAPNIDRWLSIAVSEPWCTPSRLATAISHRLTSQGSLAQAAAAKQNPLGPALLEKLAQNNLYLTFIRQLAVADPVMEAVMSAARRGMLKTASEGGAAISPALLDHACALAQQCFLNEYVFALSADEERNSTDIATRMAAMPLENIPPFLIAVTGCYRPLIDMAGSERLLERRWPAPVEALLTQQIREPLEERRLKASIPKLTAIEDEVSLSVQQQYEAHPYPRWAKLPRDRAAEPFDQLVKRKFPNSPYKPFGKESLDILVAGCGTGQTLGDSILRHESARVLAVDLSLSSLAHAKRKAMELGLSNIELAQADILKLGSLGRRFDVIDSSGVLHHLAEPAKGWRILVDLLQPHGVMQIALYSAIARRMLDPAIAFAKANGIEGTTESIRRFRSLIVALPDGDPAKEVMSLGDFYSVSNCRDLLFHVQEYRYSLPEIAAFLEENDLELIGLKLPPPVSQAYTVKFPSDPAQTNLSNWDAFERENPLAFMAMYQFWAQRRH